VLLAKAKIMKWKYINQEESAEEQQEQPTPQYIINASPGSSGAVTRVVENNIYFYGDISEANALELNSALYEMDKKLSVTNVFLDIKPIINLHINSYGGSLFAGLATVDVIRNLKSSVHSIVEGAAASAATIISVACKKRSMGKYSKMLIHQLSSGTYGKYNELEDDMENNTHLMETIKSIYKAHTNVPMKKLNEILKHDLWFDSKTCLELGLVDEIN
jgi:ATP-dependent Clp endopeptidase proteolytic subunit ClpP|tara:strand:- start:3023 stop:3676 length:654 start_codon:yes stop_codon:yes gene_type:complete